MSYFIDFFLYIFFYICYMLIFLGFLSHFFHGFVWNGYPYLWVIINRWFSMGNSSYW